MVRPRKSDSERTPGELLAAAARAFGESGLAGARLEDIARDAGVKRSSLLYHFPSKEALYEAVVKDRLSGLGRRLAGALARPGTPREVVAAVVREFRRFLDARPGLARLVVRELIGPEGPGRAILLEEVGPLLGLVEKGLEARGAPIAGASPREAVMTVAASMLLRRAAGELGRTLWGGRDRSERIAAALVLGNDGSVEGTP